MKEHEVRSERRTSLENKAWVVRFEHVELGSRAGQRAAANEPGISKPSLINRKNK